ncbi:MAG TPA: NCS1 family nucleobase:cation symporter-1 [Tepidisphaeraceae bacterium]|jgi:NCS1 family nucleobase:cation symporter-1|nr:NCS1 family nucleobase:cation symporter-1 [Tepidisphaeraceae bacterium]
MITQITSDLSTSPLWNEDLAPTTPSQRNWSILSIAALWISMSACIPTYQLASSLVDTKIGMNWWEAVLTIFLGNLIVLIPMILNAHAGTKYGIPFPVYCRASFGTRGANIPAMLRALVACGWFGIQAWIGGAAFFQLAAAFFPSIATPDHATILGITAPQFLAFMLFWLINMVVIYNGIDSIRILLNIKAPLLILLGLLLLAWAYHAAGGFGPMLSQPSQFDPGQPKAGQFWLFFFPSLTAMVGFWATLSLNIPDFSRYAKSQRDQVLGQAIGLPATMALYSFIGVAVTSATVIIFGHSIWDPIVLLSTFHSKLTITLAMLSIAVATLATNLAANVVSPANDFANLSPKYISFRTGGFITGIIGILMMPWKLIADPHGYIFTWLIAYSALLGAIGGILICDYFTLRRTQLNLSALYSPTGPYTYTAGINPRAVFALVLSISPCLPGFLHTVNLISTCPPFLDRLYTYAWFVTFFLAFILYYLLMKLLPSKSLLATE